jgi:hypothetical protein
MIPGATINLSGTEYIVPPLNLYLFFAHEAQIDVLTNPGQHPMIDYAKAASVVLLAVIQRNYPEMTADEFAHKVDFSMLSPLVQAIFAQSGFSDRPLAIAEHPANASPEPVSSDSSTAQPDGGPTTS